MPTRAALAFGAAVLLFSTFLNWFPGGIEGAYLNSSSGAPAFSGVVSLSGTADAWHAFSVIDVLLAVLVAAAAATVVLWRVVMLAAVAGGAVVLGAIVLYRAFEPPSEFFGWIGPGVVVAFGSLVLIAITAGMGAVRSLSTRTRTDR